MAHPFSLRFRKSAVFDATPDPRGSPVEFHDDTNTLIVTRAQTLQLTLASPSGFSPAIRSSATSVALPLTGPLRGTANVTFQLAETHLAHGEAGIMFFSPPKDGDALAALRYPVFRAAAGASTPFAMDLSLDVVNPLDPARTFFQFADPLLGSYFVTATGKPFAFNTVGGATFPGRAGWCSAAGRSGVSDHDIIILRRPASSGSRSTAAEAARRRTVQMLCGITGTEFLRSARRHAGRAGIRAGRGRMAHDRRSKLTAVFLDKTATTSWAQVVTASGAYISQPERSPLFSPSADGCSRRFVIGVIGLMSWISTRPTPGSPPIRRRADRTSRAICRA